MKNALIRSAHRLRALGEQGPACLPTWRFSVCSFLSAHPLQSPPVRVRTFAALFLTQVFGFLRTSLFPHAHPDRLDNEERRTTMLSASLRAGARRASRGPGRSIAAAVSAPTSARSLNNNNPRSLSTTKAPAAAAANAALGRDRMREIVAQTLGSIGSKREVQVRTKRPNCIRILRLICTLPAIPQALHVSLVPEVRRYQGRWGYNQRSSRGNYVLYQRSDRARIISYCCTWCGATAQSIAAGCWC